MDKLKDRGRNPEEAADFLDRKPITLAVWRSKGKGPNYIKIGNRIIYTDEQLDAFIEKSVVRL